MKEIKPQNRADKISIDSPQPKVIRAKIRWGIETSRKVPFNKITVKLKKVYGAIIREKDMEIFRTVCTELWRTPPWTRQRTKIEHGNLSPMTVRYTIAVIYMIQENNVSKK